MNNVSLQLQQYRALKAQATSVRAEADASILRHPEKTDYFQKLMQRWEASYLSSRMHAETGETI